MTAKTSQKLADTLRAAGFEALAKRAEADEFHDFLSPHAMPGMTLYGELMNIMQGKYPAKSKEAARAIGKRLIDGEFDADLKESDEWAASEDGQAAFRMLKEGK